MLREFWLGIASVLVVGACGGQQNIQPSTPADERDGNRIECTRSESAAAKADEEWREFRDAYSDNIQTVALSGPFDAGCRVLIVSEPPSLEALNDVQALLPRASSRFIAKSRPVGHDGWVKDFTSVLPPQSDEELGALTRQVHRALFGTDYKAYVTTTASVPPRPSGLRLEVSPADLTDWLLSEDVELVPTDDSGRKVHASAALAGRSLGVFTTATSGLVVWTLPRPTTLDGQRVDARKFAVESDLVLGAIASKNALMVIGRERMTSIDRVAPVRYETLVTLAAAGKSELQQSYERTNVLAGRYDGKNDWAPIYLSPELIDTEFGSSLNIADQHLKGWSNSGLTTYANFDYPRPMAWPFPEPLPKYLGASSLTYNWNTHGAGAIVDADDDLSVYWVRDTGALPITYLPGGVQSTRGSAAAEDGQDFFARQDDPVLVRVVQYAALYQIFQNYGVSATESRVYANVDAAGRILEEAAVASLHELSALEANQIKPAIARQLGREGFAFQVDGEPSPYAVEALMEVIGLSLKLREVDPSERDQYDRIIAHALANPERDLSQLIEKARAGVPLTDAEKEKIVGVLLAKDFDAYGTAVKAFVPDLKALRDKYVAASSANRDPIIRTPSIVVSTNGGIMGAAQGGHNLGAKVARVKLSAGRAPLVVTDTGSREIRYGMHSLRDVALSRSGEIEAVAHSAPRRASDVLGIRATSKASPHGFVVDRSRASGLVVDARGRRQSHAIAIEKTANGFTARTMGGEVIQAATHAEIVDRLSARLATFDDTVILQAAGMREDELRGLVRSCDLKMRRDALVVAGDLHAEPVTLKGAVVETPVFKTVEGGRVEASFQLTAPSHALDKSSLSTRIRVFFSKMSMARAREHVDVALARVRRLFGGRPTTVADFALELRRDLRRVDALVGLKVERLEAIDAAADFIIGLELDSESGTAREAASREG